VSFGPQAEELRERRAPRARSPVSRLRRAPPRDLWRTIPDARTRGAWIYCGSPEAGKPILVFISHPWGGGIRRHMNDLAALIGERAIVLFLEPAVDDTVKLYWPRAG
jgi:hypothetical protein